MSFPMNQGFQKPNYQPPFNQAQQLGGMQNNNQSMNQSNKYAFLEEDFFCLNDPEYDAEDFVNTIIDEVYSACMIFKKRKIQIDTLIYTLQNYSQNFVNNQNQLNPDSPLCFQDIVDDIEKNTTETIINKRIVETKAVENFQDLSKSFEESNIQQILQIKTKYEALGVLNLIPEEYLQWLQVIKESQQKLNIITFYSNIIQNTLTNIQEFEKTINPEATKKIIEQFEKDTISFIENIKLSNY